MAAPLGGPQIQGKAPIVPLDTVEKLSVPVAEPVQNGNQWGIGDWGGDPNAPDNYAAFDKAIKDFAKSKPGEKLQLAPAVYKFTTENIFYIRNMHDVVIDGQGATLMFHRATKPCPFIQFDNCYNVKLVNLNVDWDWSKSRVASLVRVIAATATSWTLDFLEVPDINPATLLQTVDMHPVNEATMTVGQYGIIEFWDLKGTTYAKVPGKPSQLVATLPRAIPKGPPVGQTYLLRHYTYEGHGLVFYNSNNITFENFNIWSTIGMGVVLENNSHSFAFRNFKITKHPTEKRLISAAADGIHCNKSLGKIILDKCEIMYQGDDALNVHDPIKRGFTVTGPDTMTLDKLPHWKMDFMPGDPIEIVKGDFSPVPYASLVKAATQPKGGETWTVQMSDPLPFPAGTDTSKHIVLNHRWSAGNVIVQNSKFGANRARGLLLECHTVLVQNNHFWRTQLSAIRIEADVGEWDEGVGTKNVVIMNNVFEDCDVQNWGHGVLWMGAGSPAKENQTTTPFHCNIRVKNNEFVNMPGAVVNARSCGDVEVFGNKIVPPGQAGTVGIAGIGKRGLPGGGVDPNSLIRIDAAAPGVKVQGNGTNVELPVFQIQS
ncbi:pectin lyase fold/virulence factor [Hyaloraphidium curvatum]|nr:pectin lyase fold/virulence factor [Hyaloraphidium curvatum]